MRFAAVTKFDRRVKVVAIIEPIRLLKWRRLRDCQDLPRRYQPKIDHLADFWRMFHLLLPQNWPQIHQEEAFSVTSGGSRALLETHLPYSWSSTPFKHPLAWKCGHQDHLQSTHTPRYSALHFDSLFMLVWPLLRCSQRFHRPLLLHLVANFPTKLLV